MTVRQNQNFDVRRTVRRPFIAGNWKMNLTRDAAVALAHDVAAQTSGIEGIDLAVCPPSVYLDAVGQALQGTKVGWGAQNMYHEAPGAFTGELCAQMLLDLGCRYVILGHSERRHILGETDLDVNRKVKAALAAKLIPIVCVGETLDEREQGRTQAVVESQFNGSLDGVPEDEMRVVVLAYEPVWAIGTGKVATPEQAEEVHADLRRLLETRYNAATAEAVRIQYGGSVKPDNASTLLSQPNIDGALVGGAALNADSFRGIVEAATL
jgi:triosephosphate isomerase